MCSGSGIDELAADTDLAASCSDAAFEHVPHTEFTADLLDVDSLALVGEARIARDDEQRFEPRERGDDVLDHTIREVFLLWVAGQILERQDGDGRLVGEREGWLQRGCRRALFPDRT